MNIKIVSEFDNKLFNRKEIKFSIENGEAQTPRKSDVKTELCKKLSLNPDNMVIVKINQEFGSRSLNGHANYYNKKELINKFEPSYILNRKNISEKSSDEKPENK